MILQLLIMMFSVEHNHNNNRRIVAAAADNDDDVEEEDEDEVVYDDYTIPTDREIALTARDKDTFEQGNRYYLYNRYFGTAYNI